ncbi:DUF4865 family protein [bacterium]|nr:DUF4865 family protein [bacterium]
MMAMQYTISLPRGHAPEAIQERVEKRHPLFVGREGLKHKSYLYNAKEAVYAPFYVWENDDELTNFLLDDLFHGVVTSFSRPRIRSWQVLHTYDANRPDKARYARLESDTIPAEADVRKLVEKEWANQTALRVHEELGFHIIGLDPDRWEIIRYSEWTDKSAAPKPEADCILEYDILDLWRKI